MPLLLCGTLLGLAIAAFFKCTWPSLAIGTIIGAVIGISGAGLITYLYGYQIAPCFGHAAGWEKIIARFCF